MAESSHTVCHIFQKKRDIRGRLTANLKYSAIKPDEKERIKARALQAGVLEPAPQLALHNALVLSKILRIEFPIEWLENEDPTLVLS